jgi:hypothetical protein
MISVREKADYRHSTNWVRKISLKDKFIKMAQASRELISEVHFQHSVWKNELFFFLDQLYIFQERLEAVVLRNTNSDVRKEGERFKEEFILQRKEIDKLLRLIGKNEEKAVKYGQLNLKRIDYVTTEDYRGLEQEVEIFEGLYKKVKKDFYEFLCKWM